MGKKTYTKREVTQALCFAMMSAHYFTTTRRREWTIWAAKVEPCQDCGAKPGKACMSLADLHNRDPQRNLNPEKNKWPHDSRVNWDRFRNGLNQRGYYSS